MLLLFVNRKHNEDRFFRVDPEGNFQSEDVATFLSVNGYRVEPTPARDKHAGGVAENSVGRIENATNTAMLAPEPPVSQLFWEYAIRYATATININYSSVIGTSPYNYETGYNINVKKLQGFFDKCWVLIPDTQCASKIGSPRAEKAWWLQYYLTKVQYELSLVLVISDQDYFGRITLTKDVSFDNQIDYNVSLKGEEPYQREWEDPESYVPSSMRAKAPAELQGPISRISRVTVPPIPVNNRVLRYHTRSLYGDRLRSSETPRVGFKVNTSMPHHLQKMIVMFQSIPLYHRHHLQKMMDPLYNPSHFNISMK